MKEAGYGIHWFRRDLRLTGNPALTANLAKHHGRVLGIFFFDRKILTRPDLAHSRFLFYMRTIEGLRADLAAQGGELLIVDEVPVTGFPEVLRALTESPLGMPATVSWNRDYEPFARARDERMVDEFQRIRGLEILTDKDHLLIEPHELAKDDGTFYQVYTPFKKRWLKLFAEDDIAHRMRDTRAGLKHGSLKFALAWPAKFPLRSRGDAALAEWIRSTATHVSHALPAAGESAARATLTRFRAAALAAYPHGRDIPGVAGTSQLSVYLKNGSITVPQIIAELDLSVTSPHLKYFEELIWREFYYHILFHHPRVETEPFNVKYTGLKWQNSEKLFRAWCAGETGYPIVDAGMRQLNETGWQHNRVRMITASFLTKDLRIDYRWGERYFMQKLLDGDLAPNNGGWQWAASTGCDPQPYFRIFNPTSQGEKFDPDGLYLKRWASEYLGRKKIHEPLKPIVDHAKARDAALQMFKEARADSAKNGIEAKSET